MIEFGLADLSFLSRYYFFASGIIIYDLFSKSIYFVCLYYDFVIYDYF